MQTQKWTIKTNLKFNFIARQKKKKSQLNVRARKIRHAQCFILYSVASTVCGNCLLCVCSSAKCVYIVSLKYKMNRIATTTATDLFANYSTKCTRALQYGTDNMGQHNSPAACLRGSRMTMSTHNGRPSNTSATISFNVNACIRPVSSTRDSFNVGLRAHKNYLLSTSPATVSFKRETL